jgi:hypothetical protein
MRRSLEIIQNKPYPIHFSKPCFPIELLNWEKHFAKKDIKTVLVPHKNGGRVVLRREVTQQEIEEIKAGLLWIRGGSLVEPDQLLRRRSAR